MHTDDADIVEMKDILQVRDTKIEELEKENRLFREEIQALKLEVGI